MAANPTMKARLSIATELRNWPIFFCEREIDKINRRAYRNRCTPHQEIMAMLEGTERIEADIDQPMLARIRKVKRERKGLS